MSSSRAKIFQIYPSQSEVRLLSNNINYCCDNACCHSLDHRLPEDSILPHGSLEIDGYPQWSTPSTTSLYDKVVSPQLWTGLLAMLLAIFMAVQVVVSLKKRRKVLPILQSESSGPFSSTRVGSGGIILPHVVYRTEPETRNEEMEKVAREIAKVKQDQEILDAMELLELTYQADTKIIKEDVFDIIPFKNNDDTNSNHNELKELIIELEDMSPKRSHPIQEEEANSHPKSNQPTILANQKPSLPLSPAYHPSRKVSLVWSENHHVQDLYRYTHFDRMVYPPGYVRETEG